MKWFAIVVYFVMIAVLLVLVRIDAVLAHFLPPAARISAATPPTDAMQLLKDVRSFYVDSWSMLLTYVTILIGFVGLVLPYILKRVFDTEAEKVRAQIRTESADKQKALSGEITDQWKKAVSDLQAEHQKELTAMSERLRGEAGRNHAKVLTGLAIAFGKQEHFDFAAAMFRLAIENGVEASVKPEKVAGLVSFLNGALRKCPADNDIWKGVPALLAMLPAIGESGKLDKERQDLGTLYEASKKPKPAGGV